MYMYIAYCVVFYVQKASGFDPGVWVCCFLTQSSKKWSITKCTNCHWNNHTILLRRCVSEVTSLLFIYEVPGLNLGKCLSILISFSIFHLSAAS
jgi:hypothetical protein